MIKKVTNIEADTYTNKIGKDFLMIKILKIK